MTAVTVPMNPPAIRNGTGASRGAMATAMSANEEKNADTTMVGPMPIQRPTRSESSAPASTPRLPMERTMPIVPRVSPSSRTT